MLVSRIWTVVAGQLGRSRAASPPLTAAGVAFVPIAALFLVGMVADPRLIGGNPAWLKPTKFAASSGIYCLTLAWLCAGLRQRPRALGWAGWVIASVLILEVGIVALQAARGTTSHFNRATPVDAALFATMGVSIAALLAASATIAVVFCRSPFEDRAWAWAVRLGMGVTVVGSTTGGLMVRPTVEQYAAAAAAGGAMPIVGAHTVGAADGGPGLAVTGWSRTHGDLRVPHFVGLHALQAIPLLSWIALRGLRPRSGRARIEVVAAVGASYAALIALLTAQALAGRPVLAGDDLSLVAGGLWVALTAIALVLVATRDRPRGRADLLAAGA